MGEAVRASITNLQKQALLVGLGTLALCVAGGFYSPTQFFRSYLLAFIFWLGVALGSIAILMLHHLVGGGWGFVIRRMLESGTRTFPILAALSLPLFFGLRHLYLWADPVRARESESVAHKAVYLNVPFFVIRTAIFFALWILLAHFLNKWSREQDATGDPGLTRRLQNLSGPGLIIYGLSVTFVSFDWVMSLEPAWGSTIYGMIFIVTQGLSALSLAIIACMLLAKFKPMSDVVSPLALNDLGNMLLTFTMLWAYLSFSQFLIIWSGNLPEEITWYLARATGDWAGVAVVLIVFHFVVPFLALLNRFAKQRIRMLAAVAAWMIVMSLVDLFWLMTPAYNRTGPKFEWMDWLAVFGIGGIWLWRYLAQLKASPLVPLNDPRMQRGVEHHA
jgi:hypothetical protein